MHVTTTAGEEEEEAIWPFKAEEDENDMLLEEALFDCRTREEAVGSADGNEVSCGECGTIPLFRSTSSWRNCRFRHVDENEIIRF